MTHELSLVDLPLSYQKYGSRLVPKTHTERTFTTRSEDNMGIEGLKEARERSLDTKSRKQELMFQDRTGFCTCCLDLGLHSTLCEDSVFISRKK